MFFAFHLVANDARFEKLRGSLSEAGFSVGAVCPDLGHRHVAPGVTVVAGGRWPRWLSGLAGLPVVGRVFAALASRWRIRAMIRAAAAWSPDVLMVFDPEALPAAVLAKRRTGARLIFDAHEYHVDEAPGEPQRARWVARTESLAAPHLDLFVTVNRSIAGLYARDARITRPAMVIRNVVAIPATQGSGALRAAAGIEAGQRVFLYHGALRNMRGLHAIVDAAAQLNPEWTTVIMGSGPMEAELKAGSRSDRVRFLPPVPHAQLGQWVGDADLGAVLYEAIGENQLYCLPNKVWELAAAGVPILASDLPEICNVVAQSKAGWLLPSGSDAMAIAALINSLDADELARAGEEARRVHRDNRWQDEVTPLLQWLKEGA